MDYVKAVGLGAEPDREDLGASRCHQNQRLMKAASVVIAGLDDGELLVLALAFHAVDQAVLARETPRPPTLQHTLQGLRLPGSLKWRAPAFLD
jgi:hypothetical protein